MSRILRRPMFRGGPVDSRGTGITSGLDDSGYADGGRVGFQVGGGLFSSGPYNPYGSYNPFSPISELAMSTNPIINRTITPEQRRNEAIASGKAFNIFAPTEEQLYEKNRPRTPKQFEEAIQKGLEITRSKPFERSDESFPSRKAMEEPNKEGTGTGTGKGGIDLDEEIFDEEKIKRESKLYEKLLGGEEARSQSIYDALLAAAPGFFKGRNLREAAPQVLESINKSGAFDKPRDIRQAAAQLAIQRRISVETARAKSDDQLTRLEKQLGAKKPSTLTERYSANIKSGINEIKAAELAVIDSYGDRYKPYAYNPGAAKKGEVYKIPKNPQKPSAGYFFAEIIDPEAGTYNPLPL
jgi:hypothetical protein